MFYITDLIKIQFPFWVCLWMFIVHWVADFKMQTQSMSQNKSTSNYWLGVHVAVYTCVWGLSLLLWALFNVSRFGPGGIDILEFFLRVLIFLVVTFISHFPTDYITSRMTSKAYKEEKYQKFFQIIGVDQILHYVQILMSFHYILRPVLGY